MWAPPFALFNVFFRWIRLGWIIHTVREWKYVEDKYIRFVNQRGHRCKRRKQVCQRILCWKLWKWLNHIMSAIKCANRFELFSYWIFVFKQTINLSSKPIISLSFVNYNLERRDRSKRHFYLVRIKRTYAFLEIIVCYNFAEDNWFSFTVCTQSTTGYNNNKKSVRKAYVLLNLHLMKLMFIHINEKRTTNISLLIKCIAKTRTYLNKIQTDGNFTRIVIKSIVLFFSNSYISASNVPSVGLFKSKYKLFVDTIFDHNHA